MKKLLYTITLTLISLSSFAQEATGDVAPAGTGNIYEKILMGVFIATALLILIVTFVLLKTVRIIAERVKNPEAFALPEEDDRLLEYDEYLAAEKTKPSFWNKVLGLRPLAEEKDLMLDHDFDGITELDNPTPAWFMWLFYSTIAFAFCYLLYFHVFHYGKLQEEEYAVEMKAATTERIAYLAKSANNIDESSVKESRDAAVLSAGQAVFAANCVACHGEKGQGLVGPNLTDEYWLHGGKIGSIFKTIKYGVPEKGMIAWEKTLNPQQISEVANYIVSLKGTKPANPKDPQGVEEEE